MKKNRAILLLLVLVFSAISAYGMFYGVARLPSILDQLIGEDVGGVFELVITAIIGDTDIYINLAMISFLVLVSVTVLVLC